MTQTREPARLESLDSIRGIAALAVLLGHTVGAFVWPNHWTRFPLLNVLFDGRSAVTMFFVLSGFVLAKPYLAQHPGKAPRKINLPTFYLRRCTRIWIPWFFVFAASVGAQRWFFKLPDTVPPPTPWLHQFWNVAPDWLDALRQGVFMQHNVLRQLLPQDWSLGVELKGSALIPLFIFLARRNILLLTLAGGLLLLLFPTGHYYFGFVLGVLLAAYYEPALRFMRQLSAPRKAAIFLAGIGLYQLRLAVSYLEPLSSLVEKTVWSLGGAGCVLIILASLASRRVERVLSHAGVVFMGRISYSVYLLQFIVILCLLPPFLLLLNRAGLHDPVLILPLAIGFTLTTNTLLSLACYRLVELPAIALGRRLTDFYEKRTARKAAPATAKN